MRTIAALAAAALVATAVAAPADARHRRHHRHHDNVEAGDVVAGVAIVGGIAAIASAIGENNRMKQDAAVDECTAEAESRLGGPVDEILGVTKRKGYYTVKGVVGLLPAAADAAAPAHGDRIDFTCTIRNGSIYSFRSGVDGA